MSSGAKSGSWIFPRGRELYRKALGMRERPGELGVARERQTVVLEVAPFAERPGPG